MMFFFSKSSASPSCMHIGGFSCVLLLGVVVSAAGNRATTADVAFSWKARPLWRLSQPRRSSLVVDALRGGAATAATANKGHRQGAAANNARGRSAAKTSSTSSSTLGGQSSMAASIFNLVNNVAGAGILALAAGKATGTGWIPSILICMALGAVSARTFIMIGEACEMTKETDFKGLWSRTLGAQTTWIVDTLIFIMCMACAVIYSGILGDVFTPLLDQFKVLPPAYNMRSTNIIAITATLLLPMSLLKNLSALAFTSILGFTAIIYTVFFIVVRALDGSYKLGSGQFVTGNNAALPFMPNFDKSTLWNVDFTSLVLASNLGLAYIAHYNGPSFYRELKDTNSARFAKMVSGSFFILVVLYIMTMAAGYSTFGDVCQGNILLNYHPSDVLATLGRLATGFSILFGFPLVAAGARESFIGVLQSLLGWKQAGSDAFHVPIVVSLLSLVTVLACTVKDVSLVVGITGATMGSFIVYICPALIYARAVKQSKGQDSPAYKSARWNLTLIPFGLFIAGLGVYMTLQEYSAKS